MYLDYLKKVMANIEGRAEFKAEEINKAVKQIKNALIVYANP